MSKDTQCTTSVFRMSYPNLFTAKKNDLNGKDEFSVVGLFGKGADLSALKKAANAAIVAKWGTDKSKYPANMKSPFRDQKDRMKDGAYPAGHEEGGVFVTFKATTRPSVVDQQLQVIIEPSKIYAGAYAKASVNAFAYSQKGNNGVSFGLNAVQLVKDGDPISGRPSIEASFTAIAQDEPGATSASDLF
jgi:ssDNA-binding protein